MLKKIAFLAAAAFLVALVLSGCMKTSYAVSGYVKTIDGKGLVNVTLSFSDGLSPVTTDSDGHWSAAGLTYGTIVTPSLGDYEFGPSSVTTACASDDADFLAVPPLDGVWTGTNSDFSMKMVVTDIRDGNVKAIVGISPNSTLNTAPNVFLPYQMSGTFKNAVLSLSDGTDSSIPISLSATVINDKMTGTGDGYTLPGTLVLNGAAGYRNFGLWSGEFFFISGPMPVSFALAKDQNGKLSGMMIMDVQSLAALDPKLFGKLDKIAKSSGALLGTGLDATGSLNGTFIKINSGFTENFQDVSINFGFKFDGAISGNSAAGGCSVSLYYNGVTMTSSGTWTATKQ